LRGASMIVRKTVSTMLIAAMLFFVPSMIPAKAVVSFPCGVPHVIGWLPTDAAFALPITTTPCPPLPSHGVPAWFWAAFACPASIILSGLVANYRDNRQLTTAEAWTCGLLYWIPMPTPQPVPHHH
jgi:hypothetical protein